VSTPVNFTLSSTHNGNVAGINGGFMNINNIVGNGSGIISINNSTKTNVIHITGPLQGYINDPTTFTGVSSLMSNSGVTTGVVFDVNGVLSYGGNSATVGGAVFYFGNISGFSGNYNSGLTPAQASAVISAVYNSSNAAITSAADTTTQNVQITNGVSSNLTTLFDSQQSDDITITNSQKITTNCS
jgi:hypothetical protein